MHAPRLNYKQAAPDGIKALSGLSAYGAKALEPRLRALIELRVSQINGCAFCLDAHSHEARAAGEAQQRLDVLSAWRDTSFFSEKEQAALAWVEAVTRLGHEIENDKVFDDLRAHFNEKEIVDLTLVVVTMNAWNRISISFHNSPVARKS